MLDRNAGGTMTLLASDISSVGSYDSEKLEGQVRPQSRKPKRHYEDPSGGLDEHVGKSS